MSFATIFQRIPLTSYIPRFAMGICEKNRQPVFRPIRAGNPPPGTGFSNNIKEIRSIRMVKIGNLELEGRAVLAPMAGVTDRCLPRALHTLWRVLCGKRDGQLQGACNTTTKHRPPHGAGRRGAARGQFSSLATNPRSWRWLQKRPWRTIRT